MKGIKKISILALGLAFVLSVSACKGKKNTTTDPETTPTTEVTPTPTSTETEESTTPIPDYVEFEDLEAALGDKSTLDNPENYPDIYINEDAKIQYRLQKITVYTNYARTKFYLGEEYSSEGLVVLASFIAVNPDGSARLDENGKAVSILANVSEKVRIDASAVDTSIMGNYTVLVNYRYNETQTQSSYNISVRSSEFETTKNLKYTAGIKAGYKEGKTPKQIDEGSIYKTLTNDGRIYTCYVTYSKKTGFVNDFTLSPTDLNISIINNEVNAVGTAFKTSIVEYDTGNIKNDTDKKTMESNDGKLKIDYSSVDTSKVGSYIVPIVYDAGDITINKETRKNVVQSFIVVDVINPIEGLYLEDGVKPEINASLDGIIDLSDYEITVERKYGPEEVMKITQDKFSVTGALTYIEGVHNVKILSNELKEDGDPIYWETEINIKPSETYTITQVNNLTGGDEYDVEIDKDGKKVVGRYEFSSDYAYANIFRGFGIQTTDSKGNVIIEGKTTICEEDKLSFVGYIYLNQLASDSYLEFKFDKPGVLILYMGSGSTDERLFGLYDNSGILIDTYTATQNKLPEKFVIEIPEAGTYKVAAVGKALTFHGFITAIKK